MEFLPSFETNQIEIPQFACVSFRLEEKSSRVKATTLGASVSLENALPLRGRANNFQTDIGLT